VPVYRLTPVPGFANFLEPVIKLQALTEQQLGRPSLLKADIQCANLEEPTYQCGIKVYDAGVTKE
jgi:hypothetical protein